MEANTEVYRTFLDEYRSDPVFFVEHSLGHYTWSKQREILRSVRDNEKTAVRACHGSSKTYTAAEVTAWFLNCFENSKVITTAPTDFQVKELLWAEINRIYLDSRIELLGECLTKKIKIEEEPDHYAIGFSTDKPQRAEGWHAPAILFIFDEAKGIESWMWDSVKGLSVGGFVRWLVISTTDGVQVGDNFYKIFEKANNGWNKVHISAEQSPYITGEKFRYIEIDNSEHPEHFKLKHIEPQELIIQITTQKWIDECERDWGRESVLFLTKVKGEIVDEGTDTVIKLSQVMRMFENYSTEGFDDSGQEEIGCDVARGGADNTEMYKRKGMKVIDERTITTRQLPPKAKLVYISKELEDFARKKRDIRIKIDDTGVGGGLTDIMQDKGYDIVPINFQQQAKDPNNYPNAISEMWFEVAAMIDEIACENNEVLQTELVNRKRKPLDKKGRRVIESKDEYKKRGFPSPDKADAFLLTFYDVLEEQGDIEWV